MSFVRKPNRLERDIYQEIHRYYLTICTKDRFRIFTNPDVVTHFKQHLKDVSDKQGWFVYAYCFMPDHLHILVEPREVDLNLGRFVSLFKQLSGYWFKQNFGKPAWQKSYHDHILRRDEDMDKVTQYIFDNPVRAKLVDDWQKYPYSGSFTVSDHFDAEEP